MKIVIVSGGFDPIENWHQISNPFKKKVYIIEIQYGEECIEEDIERINNLS